MNFGRNNKFLPQFDQISNNGGTSVSSSYDPFGGGGITINSGSGTNGGTTISNQYNPNAYGVSAGPLLSKYCTKSTTKISTQPLINGNGVGGAAGPVALNPTTNGTFPGTSGGFTKILKGPKMQNIEDCINACNENIKCMLYSFGNENGTCYLQDKFDLDGITKAEAGKYLSGVSSRIAANNKRQLMSLDGLSIDDGTAWTHQFKSTPQQCQTIATYDPNVSGGQYNNKTGMCKLQLGKATQITYDPYITSFSIYESNDQALEKWIKNKYPKIAAAYHNWLQNDWPADKTTIGNWISTTYPQLKSEFEQWKSGLQAGLPKYEDDYSKFLDWMHLKYPMYKSAYDKIKPYIDKIPADRRTDIEEFIVWVHKNYPGFVDRIFNDAEELFAVLKKWIGLLANYLQSHGKIPINTPPTTVVNTPISPFGY